MPFEFSNFASALACFVAEFVGLSILVTGFVLAQYHRAWGTSTLRQHSKPTELHRAR